MPGGSWSSRSWPLAATSGTASRSECRSPERRPWTGSGETSPRQRLKQVFRDFAKHYFVALRGKMNVAFDEQPLVPIRMGVFFREECRQQIDEPFAFLPLAEFLPNLYLTAFAIVIGKLRWPGITDDRH